MSSKSRYRFVFFTIATMEWDFWRPNASQRDRDYLNLSARVLITSRSGKELFVSCKQASISITCRRIYNSNPGEKNINQVTRACNLTIIRENRSNQSLWTVLILPVHHGVSKLPVSIQRLAINPCVIIFNTWQAPWGDIFIKRGFVFEGSWRQETP